MAHIQGSGSVTASCLGSILLAAVLAGSCPAGAQTVRPPPDTQSQTTGGQAVSDPKADCEALMNSVLLFAEQMLTAHGGFFPFGGAMRVNGQLVWVGGYDGKEQPRPTDIIGLIKDAFIESARQGQYKATAVVYDVRVILPSTGDKSDAIAVSLNHRDSYSISVIIPYKIDSGKLILGAAFDHKGEGDIFPPQ
jgi:hypothetical protein